MRRNKFNIRFALKEVIDGLPYDEWFSTMDIKNMFPLVNGKNLGVRQISKFLSELVRKSVLETKKEYSYSKQSKLSTVVSYWKKPLK